MNAPTQVADYTIAGEIGDGGHGTFYVATPPARLGDVGSQVVVKLVPGGDDAAFRRFTREPVLIAETSVQTGPAEVACAHHLFGSVTRHRDVLGLIWFDYSKGGVDWRVESRPILRAAVAKELTGLPLVPLG